MKNELLTRAYIVAGVLALVAVFVFAQTFRIAVQEGPRWRAKGDSLHIKYVPVEAPRGNILADNGALLATSLPFYEVRMDTRAGGLTDEVFTEGIDSLAYYISTRVNPRRSVDSTARWLRAARAKGDRYLLIHKKASYPIFEEMRKWPIFRRGQNRGGFIALRGDTRKRPFGMMAQRTIGYKRNKKLVGLEGSFDYTLSGEEGRRPMMRLPGNHYLPVEDLQHASPKSGNDIQTTLDVSIQDVVQQELKSAIIEHLAEYGVAIVIETKTGAIRAMSSLELQKNGGVSEVFNHAVATRIEPGSTFKLASMLALLDDSRVRLEDTIRLFKGKYQFYDTEMQDASLHGLDTTTAQRAFEISSNVGIARLVEKGFANDLKGRQAFVEKLRQFHLDESTGVEIVGEKFPLIKDPTHDSLRSWSGITLPWMSMGYEVEFTPLQMAAFYNAVANNGKYMKPRLVSNIQREGSIVESFEPLVLDNAIASKSAIKGVKNLLEGVVENGTAKKFKSNLYRFAGKTGTVQYKYSKAEKNKGLNGHQASFIGYFPAEDPHYTMLVLISHPKQGGIYGSDVALPVWRDIADKLFAADPELNDPVYARIEPRWNQSTLPRYSRGAYQDIDAVFASLNIKAFHKAQGGMVKLESPGDTLNVVPINIPGGRVPDVVGMGARDAMFLLENLGLSVDLRGKGRVKRQSIKAGTKINGQYIKLVLG